MTRTIPSGIALAVGSSCQEVARWGAVDKMDLGKGLVAVELNWGREVGRRHRIVVFPVERHPVQRRPG